VHGSGDHDLLFTTGPFSNIGTAWESVEAHRLFERLGPGVPGRRRPRAALVDCPALAGAFGASAIEQFPIERAVHRDRYLQARQSRRFGPRHLGVSRSAWPR
jgi:hypothetical protein